MQLARALPVVLIAIAPFVAPLAQASSSPPIDVTGGYASNWEDVQLAQKGHHITGSYVCCGGGVIEGTIEGRTIRYHWKQPGGEGRGVWTVEDGRLRGTWGWGTDEDDGGRWDLTPPSQLAQ